MTGILVLLILLRTEPPGDFIHIYHMFSCNKTSGCTCTAPVGEGQSTATLQGIKYYSASLY